MDELTTLGDAKNFLGILVDTDDDAITALVAGVSTWVRNRIGQDLAAGAYTEVRNGTRGRVLPLNHTPVTAITSLTIDGVAIPPRAAFGRPGYYLANDTLFLDGGLVFTKGLANVVAVYTAGYSAVPPDLAMCARKLVGIRYREKQHLGQTSKTLAGETVSFDMSALPGDVKDVLEFYTRRVWSN